MLPAMSWMDDEPVRGSYPSIELLALSGIDRMRAAAKGLFPKPPIHHLFGLTPLSSSVAQTTFVMPASPWLQFGDGTLDFKILLEEAPLRALELPGAAQATSISTPE